MNRVYWLLLAAVLFLWAHGSACGATDPAAVLPANTLFLVHVAQYDVTQQRFEQSQFGRFADDPQLKAFTDQVDRHVRQQLDSLVERVGLTWSDLESVLHGEVVIAARADAQTPLAVVLWTDVSQHAEPAKQLWAKLAQAMRSQRAESAEVQRSGALIRTYRLPAEEGQAATTIAATELAGNLFVSDQLELLEDVLKRRQQPGTEALAQTTPYQRIVSQSVPSPAQAVDIAWFVSPFALADAVSARDPDSISSEDQRTLEVLTKEGFRAVEGVGGTVQLAQAPFDLLTRSFVYARPQRERSMRMLQFENRPPQPIPAWIPPDVSTCTRLHLKVKDAFQHAGTLFDEVIGEGDEGLFAEVLSDLRDAEDGPRVDIERELLDYLSDEILLVTDYVVPINSESEASIVAIPTLDEPRVATALRRLLQNEDGVYRRSFQDLTIWEIEGREAGGVQVPSSALTTANGHLLISTNYRLLIGLLDRTRQSGSLADDPEFQRVEQQAQQLLGNQRAAFLFSRTREDFYPTYELLRMNKLDQDQGLYSSLLKPILLEDGTKPRVDGGLLPDYEKVGHHFAPAGIGVQTHDDGWQVVGYTLQTAK
jgi:hypothetical protein